MEDKKNVPVELDDEQLEQAAGGFNKADIEESHTSDDEGTKYCVCCGRGTIHIYGAITVKCSVCGKTELL